MQVCSVHARPTPDHTTEAQRKSFEAVKNSKRHVITIRKKKKNATRPGRGCCRHTIPKNITVDFPQGGGDLADLWSRRRDTPPHPHTNICTVNTTGRHHQPGLRMGSGTLRKRHKSNDSISRTPATREGAKASIREIFFALKKTKERDTHTSTRKRT